MITREKNQRTRQVPFDSKTRRENDSKLQFYQQCPQIPVRGHLRFFLENWEKITDDQWVLSVVEEGYKLEFIKCPPQSEKLQFRGKFRYIKCRSGRIIKKRCYRNGAFRLEKLTPPRTSIIVQFIFYFGPLRSAIIF